MPLPSWNDNEVDLLRKITQNTSAGGPGGGGVNIEGGGAPIVSSATVNFEGAGVTVTDVGGVATVTIPGGSSGAYTTSLNFSALPAAAAHANETYLVLNPQGTIWLANRRPAGLYTSDGASWIYDADQTTAFFSGIQPTNGQIPVGNGSVFVTQSVGGDATLAATGTLTIANGAVTNAKAADMANSTIKARITAGTGDPEDASVSQMNVLLQGDGSVGGASGFRNIPQNSQSVDYTAVLADSGKHLLHPSSDANARDFTIPAHGSVAFPLGTSITFVNRTTEVLSIEITTDTLILAGTTTTGTRSLALNGMATAIKITFGAAPDIWIISGAGLT